MTDDDRVYSAIRAQDGITVAQLLADTGLSLDVVSPIVRRGFDKGQITTDANFKLHTKGSTE